MSTSSIPGRVPFPLAVLAADIGSTATGRFAWCEPGAKPDEKHGTTPSTLVARVVEHLNQGTPVALGFECPLYVPLHSKQMDLTKGRVGDGNRAWSAGAGCGSLATGLVQVAWVLRELREPSLPAWSIYLDWASFATAESGLFLWEAFVTNKPKQEKPRDREADLKDARGAANAFHRKLPHPTTDSDDSSSETYSLIGAALLRTGWSTDLEILKQPCLVIKGKPEAQ